MRIVDGLLAALLADLATAQAELGEALEWLRAHEDDEATAGALAGLGIATAPADPDRARRHLLESARLFATTEDAWGEAMTLGALGWLDTGRGDFTAEDLFERAFDLAGQVDAEIATAHTATNLAELRLAQERHDEARDLVDVALTACETVRVYDGLSYGLEAAARYAWGQGDVENAARLLGAADGLREEAGVPIWGARLTRFETFADSLRRALDVERFDAAWSGGRALGFDPALDAARRVLGSPGATEPVAGRP
jgi:tetratricopeptide (TPR) repeat protein